MSGPDQEAPMVRQLRELGYDVEWSVPRALWVIDMRVSIHDLEFVFTATVADGVLQHIADVDMVRQITRLTEEQIRVVEQSGDENGPYVEDKSGEDEYDPDGLWEHE